MYVEISKNLEIRTNINIVISDIERMSRFNYFFVLALCFVFVWIAPRLTAITNGMFHAHPRLDYHWNLIPLYCIILFGIYSGSIVLYRITQIKDYPESKKELLKDIQMAKKLLEKRGFRSD